MGRAPPRRPGILLRVSFSPLVAAAAPLLFTAGCGASAEQTARRSLATAAELVLATDREAATGYRTAHAEALDGCPDRACYDARMTPWNRTEEALRAAREALFAAQAAVDASGAGGWLDALPCLAAAFAHLVAALEVALPAAAEPLRVVTAALGVAGECTP